MNQIPSQVCLPEIYLLLQKLEDTGGEYSVDATCESTICILEKCLPLSDSDEEQHRLLSACAGSLCAALAGSEPWRPAVVRRLARLACVPLRCLSDASLRRHHGPLEDALQALISCRRPAAALHALTQLGPQLLGRAGFAAKHGARLAAGDPAELERCLAATCALADRLLPEPVWRLVLAGLAAGEPLLRKRRRPPAPRRHGAARPRRPAAADAGRRRVYRAPGPRWRRRRPLMIWPWPRSRPVRAAASSPCWPACRSCCRSC